MSRDSYHTFLDAIVFQGASSCGAHRFEDFLWDVFGANRFYLLLFGLLILLDPFVLWLFTSSVRLDGEGPELLVLINRLFVFYLVQSQPKEALRIIQHLVGEPGCYVERGCADERFTLMIRDCRWCRSRPMLILNGLNIGFTSYQWLDDGDAGVCRTEINADRSVVFPIVRRLLLIRNWLDHKI